MERIEINGVWYVREDSQFSKTLTIGENDVTHYRGIVHESEDYCFEATKLYKDFTTGQDYDDIEIKIAFKERGVPQKDWKTEYWDHAGFFQGILKNHPESINIVRKEFGADAEGMEIFKAFLETFKAFLVYLQKIHWL
jgi:hypothetical protein